jgi:hypothetical protein
LVGFGNGFNLANPRNRLLAFSISDPLIGVTILRRLLSEAIQKRLSTRRVWMTDWIARSPENNL